MWRNRLRVQGSGSGSGKGKGPASANGADAVAGGAGGEEDGKSEAKPPAAPQQQQLGLGRKESVPPILVAALGHEPRMGRWMKMKTTQGKGKGVRSGALVLPLKFKEA